LEASAMPKHKGNATRNTTIDAGKSAPIFFRYELARLIINWFKNEQ